MARKCDTPRASHGERLGSDRVYYPGPQIIVTSRRIKTADGCYPVRELGQINQVHGYAYPARTLALICGAIELALALPLALAIGSAAMLCVGFVSAAGLALALLVDGRRNPRWMALNAIHDGQEITLFSSRYRREFEQVRRAVIRAVEANRLPQL